MKLPIHVFLFSFWISVIERLPIISSDSTGKGEHLQQASSSYITYLLGSIPVILSTPHGGNEKPEHIPDRDAGCWNDNACVYRHNCGNKDFQRCPVTTVLDSYTRDLTMLLRDELHALYGEYPHVVINELHRTKMDANREVDEATFGEPEAVEAWNRYHEFIEQSKAAIGGPGLFLDIHGHGHDTQWAELGYLISGKDLDGGHLKPEASSIFNLAKTVSIPFEELVRGNASFGTLLQRRGFESVPSDVHPGPEGMPYFSGGYNAQVHGSRGGGAIDAIQIESPFKFRDKDMREDYAVALALSIRDFLEVHYHYSEVDSGAPGCQAAFLCIALYAAVIVF